MTESAFEPLASIHPRKVGPGPANAPLTVLFVTRHFLHRMRWGKLVLGFPPGTLATCQLAVLALFPGASDLHYRTPPSLKAPTNCQAVSRLERFSKSLE